MIYASALTISLIVLYLTQKIKFKLSYKSYNGVILGIAFVLLIFSIITGSRSVDVGTDTINYYYSAENILNSGLSPDSILESYYVEPGYGILEWLVMNVFRDVHALFFIESIVLFLGLFSFISNYAEAPSYALSFLVFFCFYYNTSLNISRQYLAVGICFFAFKYLFNERPKQYLLLSLIACFFHSSAILMFATFIIVKYLNDSKTNKDYYIRLILLMTILFIVLLFVNPVATFLSSIGIIPTKYVEMLHSSNASSSLIMILLAYSPLLALCLLFKDQLIKSNPYNKIAIALYILGFFISVMNSLFGNVGRLAVYWSSMQIMLYPECCSLLVNRQKTNTNKFIINTAFISLLLLYWYYCYIFRNFGETYPYVSDYFNWLNWSF